MHREAGLTLFWRLVGLFGLCFVVSSTFQFSFQMATCVEHDAGKCVFLSYKNSTESELVLREDSIVIRSVVCSSVCSTICSTVSILVV